MAKQLLSIVLPAYNEEKNVKLIHAEVLKYIDRDTYNYEFIFVNDGSKDTTWAEIEKLSQEDSRVNGINFSRNFGHHAALQAGLESAKGDAVIMMDADLQHPPKLIPVLVAEWKKGYDVVLTVRKATEGVGWYKKTTSRLFYKLLNSVSDLKLNDGEADYRLLSRKALDSLNALPESPKFYRGLVNWIGFEAKRVEYEANARQFGVSSYTLGKMIELARLGLTSFSMRPLKFIITVGLFLVGFSLLSLAVMLTVKFGINAYYFSNNAILVMFLIFVTGLLTTFQGVVAIYLVDIFNAAKARPPYIVSKDTYRRDD